MYDHAIDRETSAASESEPLDPARQRYGSQKPSMSITAQSQDSIPDNDTLEKNAQYRKTATFLWSAWIRRHCTGERWRLTIASGVLVGGVVLLMNVIFIIVIYTRFEVRDHSAIIYRGSCSTSASTIIGLHFLINALSIILLSCSNYSMQCLSSPSRSEIDTAHARGKWLSVGVQNIRNLFYVARPKALLWILLAFSSVPLHLFWNSTVFQTLTVNNYVTVSITEDFLNGAPWSPFGYQDIDNAVDKLQRAAQAGSLERLEPAECIRAYAQYLQHSRRDVLLVSAVSNSLQVNGTASSAFAAYTSSFTVGSSTSFNWMCDGPPSFLSDAGPWACNTSYLDSVATNDAGNWIPGLHANFLATALGDQHNLTVAYCLSEVVPEQCTVSVVPLFLVIVIACNVIKIMAFLATLSINKMQPPLVTTGDAIQSFLETPDDHTKDRCLASKEDYETFFRKSRQWQARDTSAAGDVWTGGRKHWGKAARWYTWWFFAPSACFAVIAAGFLYGPDGLVYGTHEPWPLVTTLGIGQPQPGYTFVISGSADLIVAVVTANSPQLVVTYIYLFYNNLVTAMLTMAEWCTFGSAPAKGLRVSNPKKDTAQRATYYLQIPYRYGIPSIVLIGVLHWLVSQMVFLAKIDVYDLNGDLIPSETGFESTGSITSVFYSPLAMLLAVSLGAGLLIVLFAFAILARYPGDMPLSAGCSASLAAACQPNRGQTFSEELSSRPLIWAATNTRDGLPDIGHATFSDLPVMKLVKGHRYE